MNEKDYYLINIENIDDINSHQNFLREMYPKLYSLYQRLNYALYANYTFDEKKTIITIKRQIETLLEKYHLPEYIIFTSTDTFLQVEELFSKEKIYLSREFMEESRIQNRQDLGDYLNHFEAEEILTVCDIFPQFTQKNRKGKILTFSKYKYPV